MWREKWSLGTQKLASKPVSDTCRMSDTGGAELSELQVPYLYGGDSESTDFIRIK